jgi:hypothetical protein
MTTIHTFRAVTTVNQNLGTGFTALATTPVWNVIFDTGGHFNASNGRWSPPGSVLTFGIALHSSGGFNDNWNIGIMKNGATYLEGLHSRPGIAVWHTGNALWSWTVVPAGGDYYQAGGSVGSGNNTVQVGSVFFGSSIEL